LVVFDSWALLAYLGDEPAAGRVESVWLDEGAAISSVNLGEARYIRMRQDGEESALAAIDQIRGLLDVIDPDWPLVSVAASIKARGRLSYADAFCIATALRA
jgi:predicted nucleic acid-binding protein